MQLSTIRIDYLPNIRWKTARFKTLTNPNFIDVWRINVATLIPFLYLLQPLLSPGEAEKVVRYKQETDQQRYLIGKAALRILVGRYLNVDPKLIPFRIGENKKPELENNFEQELHFNISHSGNYILIAIANTPVGIDVEKMDASFIYQNLLPFSFNEEEADFIEKSKLPFQSFYRLWTRKESLLKATGKGLVDELSRVPSLTGDHQNPTAIIGSTENWKVSSFNVDENHAGSIAFMPVKTALQFFNFQL